MQVVYVFMGQKLTVNAAGPSGCRVLNAHLASFFLWNQRILSRKKPQRLVNSYPTPRTLGLRKAKWVAQKNITQREQSLRSEIPTFHWLYLPPPTPHFSLVNLSKLTLAFLAPSRLI